jgi:hypothetical protein
MSPHIADSAKLSPIGDSRKETLMAKLHACVWEPVYVPYERLTGNGAS